MSYRKPYCTDLPTLSEPLNRSPDYSAIIASKHRKVKQSKDLFSESADTSDVVGKILEYTDFGLDFGNTEIASIKIAVDRGRKMINRHPAAAVSV